MLTSSGIVSAFDKNTSFDRLFPNQDNLSGKGLGNLIALPLNGTSLQQGNSCFINPITLHPYSDQWQFLQQIERVSTEHFEGLFSKLSNTPEPENDKGILNITLRNNIVLNKNAIDPTLFHFINEELNFLNTEFFIKKNSGRNTFGTDRYFRFIEELGNNILLPKGFIGKLIRFCRDNSIAHSFIDQRKLNNPVTYSFQANLRSYQQESMEAINKKDIGVIVAPPGSGKTVMALKIVAEKQQPALITTGQFFGEGSDLQNTQCLFLVYPFSFKGKLIQYMGRVQRSEISPTIFDYRDIKIDYLNRMFLKRNVYYRKLEKQRTLFDLPDEENIDQSKPLDEEIILERTIKVKIEDLEFLYGSFQFRYSIPEYSDELIFDIENLNIRPEFEVLKPYFENFFKSKTVTVFITAIMNKQKAVTALSASSSDLEKLNREIIEGVRFRFVERNFFGKSFPIEQKGLKRDLSTGTGSSIYESAEELLSDVLSRDNYKHQKQLHYLAERHEGSVLKIRFVLSPFAFVFLLTGIEQYHIVMETLDTEEATYIWHLSKNINALKQGILEIDKQLNKIRNEGRQLFLETNPNNFSRIIHDYSNERKGFVLWKDALEERLV